MRRVRRASRERSLVAQLLSPTPAEAHALGMVTELVPPAELVDRTVAVAELTPEDCLEQDAFTKRACQASALRDIAGLADPLDGELPDAMTSDHARHTRRAWRACNRHRLIR
jgi:enoyl-CoA hydratase